MQTHTWWLQQAQIPACLTAWSAAAPREPCHSYFPSPRTSGPVQQPWTGRDDECGLQLSRAWLLRLRHFEVTPCSRWMVHGWRGTLPWGEKRPWQLVLGSDGGADWALPVSVVWGLQGNQCPVSAAWAVYCFNTHLKKGPVGDLVINHSHSETDTCLHPHTCTWTQSSSDYGSIRINIEQTQRDFQNSLSGFFIQCNVICFSFFSSS